VGFTPRLSTAVWVGYPNDRTQMNGLYFGRNVDGGTFPAAIWGAYMMQAKGSYCGDFRQPKESFQSSSFSGDYASTGGNRLGFGDKPEEDEEAEPEEPADDNDAPEGGTEFDPEKYEAAPQPAPDTGDGGDGTTP
jgi:penicillin-binding protein 1A